MKIKDNAGFKSMLFPANIKKIVNPQKRTNAPNIPIIISVTSPSESLEVVEEDAAYEAQNRKSHRDLVERFFK